MPMSQNDTGVLSNFLTPRGYEQIDLSSGTVQTLQNIPAAALQTPILALIQGDDGDVRWLDSGINPTALFGEIIFGKATLQYNGINLSALRLIKSATNGATKANVIYYSYATVQEIPLPIIPPILFCPLLNLPNAVASNVTPINVNSFIQATNIAGGATQAVFSSIPIIINAQANKIYKFETTVQAPSAFNASEITVGLVDNLFAPTAYNGIIIKQNTNVADTQIETANGTIIATGLTLTYPYTFHYEIDTNTNTVYFNDGVNSGSALGVGASLIGFSLSQVGFLVCPTGVGESNSLTWNGTGIGFMFPNINPTAILWCQS